MNLSKKLYQELSPKQRGVAVYGALNRSDFVEADRLFHNAPRGSGQGKAFLAIGQALDSYNLLLSKVTMSFLAESGRLKAALTFCVAWTSAGGDRNNKEYKKNCSISKSLLPVVKQLAREIATVHQATREWCQKNEIPEETFSGHSCIIPLRPADTDSAVDRKMLNILRDMYDRITLTW